MPALLAGYTPAAVPPPGDESDGAIVTGAADPRGFTITPSYQLAGTLGIAPAAPELRVPGVDDRPAMHPAAQVAPRTDRVDADDWVVNPGTHVAQVAGAAQPSGSMAPEPPIYGSTWRLEPAPASAGDYIGGR
jgi:hypothetical protein